MTICWYYCCMYHGITHRIVVVGEAIFVDLLVELREASRGRQQRWAKAKVNRRIEGGTGAQGTYIPSISIVYTCCIEITREPGTHVRYHTYHTRYLVHWLNARTRSRSRRERPVRNRLRRTCVAYSYKNKH